jgi:hypothetical protein
VPTIFGVCAASISGVISAAVAWFVCEAIHRKVGRRARRWLWVFIIVAIRRPSPRRKELLSMSEPIEAVKAEAEVWKQHVFRLSELLMEFYAAVHGESATSCWRRLCERFDTEELTNIAHTVAADLPDRHFLLNAPEYLLLAMKNDPVKGPLYRKATFEKALGLSSHDAMGLVLLTQLWLAGIPLATADLAAPDAGDA